MVVSNNTLEMYDGVNNAKLKEYLDFKLLTKQRQARMDWYF